MDVSEYQTWAAGTSSGAGLVCGDERWMSADDPLLVGRFRAVVGAVCDLAEGLKKHLGHGHAMSARAAAAASHLDHGGWELWKHLTTLAYMEGRRPKTAQERLRVAVLGLIGEAGELWKVLDKNRVPEPQDNIISEIGDLAWYLAEICSTLGLDLGKVMEANVEKLKKRYPEGFTVERSVNRAEGGGAV